MRFIKMEGLGNDYLYVFSREEPQEPEKVARRLSHRHYGPGADGVIWVLPSERADFRMRIFNADGSEAQMSGSGLCCLGKYVYEQGYTQRTHLTIESLAGLQELDLQVKSGEVQKVTVDMGKARVSPLKELEILGVQQSVVPVSVGNDHAVLFVENAEEVPVEGWGTALQNCGAFPEGVNCEFVELRSPTCFRMRAWERGAGITMACGTGACAAAAAAVAAGFCPYNTEIEAILDGGSLFLRVCRDGRIFMTGPANRVYRGEIEL